MIYSVVRAHQVQLRSCQFSNPGAPELGTGQGERRRHQDLALTAERDYTPEHGAERLTRRRVPLPMHVFLVSVRAGRTLFLNR